MFSFTSARSTPHSSRPLATQRTEIKPYKPWYTCMTRLQEAALHVVRDVRQVHAPQLAPIGHIAH